MRQVLALQHVQVLDQYFKRASDVIKTNFVQSKGFSLLAAQLKQFNVSVQLISALVSMALGQEVNLFKEQLVLLPFTFLYTISLSLSLPSIF